MIELFAILGVLGTASALYKCCPLNHELSIVGDGNTTNIGLECQQSTTGTMSVTYTANLTIGLPQCGSYDLVSAYDRLRNVSCLDRVSQLGQIAGVACDIPGPVTFPIPSVFNFRKCCPLNRTYDADGQYCWSPYADTHPGALEETLKIVFKREDTFVNVTFGAPPCGSSEVLVDTVIPYQKVSFLPDHDGFTINGEEGVLSTPDGFCADLVDHRFEYVVIRSCRNPYNECKHGKHVCISKCCPVDFEMQGKMCVPGKRPLSMTIYNLSYPEVPAKNHPKPAFLQGINCPNGKHVLDDDNTDKHILTTDGRILMVTTNVFLDTESYCLENLRSSNETKTLRCFQEKEHLGKMLEMKWFLSTICATVSALFLLLTFLIYALLPPLRNEHGKLVMCYLVTSAASYLSIVAQQVLPRNELPPEVCRFEGKDNKYILIRPGRGCLFFYFSVSPMWRYP